LTKRIGITLLCMAVIGLPQIASAQKMYKWVDKNGQVYFSDKVPPDAANFDRDVLNERGVTVGRQEGEITDDERTAKEAKDAEEAAARATRAEVARHDRMLLETYISVSDIEDLRDRRVGLLESQITVAENYLSNLRKRLIDLQSEASKFKPYTTDENALPIPRNLAVDLSRTLESINVYEQTLSRTRSEQQALRESFDRDIARFRELKGG
jgi:hypothetical protein